MSTSTMHACVCVCDHGGQYIVITMKTESDMFKEQS